MLNLRSEIPLSEPQGSPETEALPQILRPDEGLASYIEERDYYVFLGHWSSEDPEGEQASMKSHLGPKGKLFLEKANSEGQSRQACLKSSPSGHFSGIVSSLALAPAPWFVV